MPTLPKRSLPYRAGTSPGPKFNGKKPLVRAMPRSLPKLLNEQKKNSVENSIIERDKKMRKLLRLKD